MKKTVLVTGASRGIGLAIALRFAAAQANVVVVSADLPTTLEEVSREITGAGAEVLVINADVADAQAIQETVKQATDRFGGIDILVNNVSATCLADTEHLTVEQFDRMVATSVRAAFFLSQACLPYLKKAKSPHIINISPPLCMELEWFKDHLGFSLSKYAMSLCTLGMSAAFHAQGIAVNSLWPETTIATQTIKDHFSPKVFAASRWPSIMGEAAYALSLRDSLLCSGKFFTDEALLREEGVVDFSHYAVDAKVPLMQAFFVPRNSERLPVSQDLYLRH